MTTAHATLDLLAAYADGSLSEGWSLIVASHLTFCPACRSRVAGLEALGGALLQDGDAVAPTPACLAGALARVARDEPEAPAPVAVAGSPLPAPLRTRLGLDLGDIGWSFLLPGLSEHRLNGFEKEDVRLMRARPGVRIFQHTHAGEEATLVLSGRMRDGDRVLARGDLALAGRADEHHPEIVGAETCVCLVVSTGSMRFTGRIGRALNLFTR